MPKLDLDVLEADTKEELDIEVQNYLAANPRAATADFSYASYEDYETKETVYTASLIL